MTIIVDLRSKFAVNNVRVALSCPNYIRSISAEVCDALSAAFLSDKFTFISDFSITS